MNKKFQLKNGMNVLLIESRKSPVVAVQMWVKTGSADEIKGIEGISHFIEHLVFKGSTKYGVGEIAQAVENAGGVLNAYTTFDQTVFYVTVSKEFVDTGLDVISEMMGQPKFDKIEIDNEREVVIEEIKRSNDNPRQQASRLLFATQYKKHPYGVPVIGYDKNIRKVSREKILNYYNQRYVPENMNLVIVGDFETAEMKKKVESVFAAFKNYKLKKIKRPTEPEQKKQQIVVRKMDFAEHLLYLAWPIPNAKHKDLTALGILAQILGQGESSRLVTELKNKRGLANSIGASIFSPKDRGFFAISSSIKGGNLPVVLDGISRVIEEFFISGPKLNEIHRAIKNLESEKLYSMETVDGLASLYGHFELIYNDFNYFNRLLTETKNTSAKDIINVAKKYLRPERMNVTFLTNEETTASITKIKKWTKTLKKKPATIKIKSSKISGNKVGIKWKPKKKTFFSHPEKIKLTNGSTLLVQRTVGAPVTSMRIGFLGGARYEEKSKPGVGEFATRVWPCQTLNFTEAKLNERIDDLSAGISAFNGRNSTGLSLSTLQPHFFETLNLLEEILLQPAWEASIVERERDLILEHLKLRADKPAQVCMLAMNREMFGKHPYGLDPFGGKTAVQSRTISNMKSFVENILHPKAAVISVVGDIEPKILAKKIEKITNQIPSGQRRCHAGEMSPLRSSEHVFIESNKEQTHLVLAYRGIKVTDPARATLEVMQSILSGQGGRLFVELRDKASLAYTVAPMRMDGLDGGYFGAYIGCSPEKADKAVSMMLQEFDKLTNVKTDALELERAKKFLIGRHDIALQRASHVADLMLFDELYGLAFDEFENFHDKIRAVTSEDICQLAKKIFSQKHVLSIVGQKNLSIAINGN